MCPKCWIPHQWKIKEGIGWFILETILLISTCLIDWDMFKHKQTARVINVEIYPKFKDV